VTFFASDRMYRTDWFRFHVQVRRGEILRLDPMNIAAQRVRKLDDEEEAREMVKDVASAAAAGA